MEVLKEFTELCEMIDDYNLETLQYSELLFLYEETKSKADAAKKSIENIYNKRALKARSSMDDAIAKANSKASKAPSAKLKRFYGRQAKKARMAYKKEIRDLDKWKADRLKKIDTGYVKTKAKVKKAAKPTKKPISSAMPSSKNATSVTTYTGSARQRGKQARSVKKMIKAPKTKKAAIATVIAATGAAGYQVYKNRMSKAARACGGKSGLEKQQCMINNRKQALMAQAQKLAGSMSKCDTTRDPTKCKAKIQSKIEKLKARATTD